MAHQLRYGFEPFRVGSKGALCAYCKSAGASHPTFTRRLICDRCDSRRRQMGALLSLIVRGDTPECVQLFAGLSLIGTADAAEAQEMADFVDLLLAIGGGS